MRAWVLSDLHVDRNPDLDLGQHPDCDIILMAGDLADGDFDAVPWMLRTFSVVEREKLVYVPGNHDAYGIGLAAVQDMMAHLSSQTGIITLDDAVLERNGCRIVGSSLWSPFSPALDQAYGSRGDFRHVPGLTPDRWRAEHARHRAWLESTLQPGDVLLVHHAVSFEGLATEMQHNLARMMLSSGYNADIEDLIEEKRPSLVVHGHSHVRRDYDVAGVPVVTNALGRGWSPHDRTHFVPGLVIDLPVPLFRADAEPKI